MWQQPPQIPRPPSAPYAEEARESQANAPLLTHPPHRCLVHLWQGEAGSGATSAGRLACDNTHGIVKHQRSAVTHDSAAGMRSALKHGRGTEAAQSLRTWRMPLTAPTGDSVRSAPRISHTSRASNHTSGCSSAGSESAHAGSDADISRCTRSKGPQSLPDKTL